MYGDPLTYRIFIRNKSKGASLQINCITDNLPDEFVKETITVEKGKYDDDKKDIENSHECEIQTSFNNNEVTISPTQEFILDNFQSNNDTLKVSIIGKFVKK